MKTNHFVEWFISKAKDKVYQARVEFNRYSGQKDMAVAVYVYLVVPADLTDEEVLDAVPEALALGGEIVRSRMHEPIWEKD